MQVIKNIMFLTILSLVVFACNKKDEQDSPAPIPTDSKSGTFTDSRDKQEYGWVKIGTQTWMSENLEYDNGTSNYYNNDSTNNHIYGRFYYWTDLMDGASSSNSTPSGVQGLCPAGWHLPSVAEYEILIAYLNANNLTASDLKNSTSLYWATGGTNSTGFNVLPAGTMYNSGNASANKGTVTDLLTSTAGTVNGSAQGMTINISNTASITSNLGNTNLWSCRCIKD